MIDPHDQHQKRDARPPALIQSLPELQRAETTAVLDMLELELLEST